MRVATSYMNQQSLLRMQKNSADLELTSYQITSGLKARQFSDIAEDVNQLLDFQDLYANNAQYVENLNLVNTRLSAMENALQGMSDLLVEAANLYTLGRNENTADVRATLAPEAEGLTESFYSLFKTEYNGRFVFSGAAGDRSPITSSPTANTAPGFPAPTTYYNGDSQRPQVLTATGLRQEYGVTGDEQAFADMKAGLEALWYGLENNSETDIDAAIDYLNQAQTEISGLLGQVGGQQNSFDLLINTHENTNIFLESRISELQDVDISEATTRFAQQEAALQASMLVITRLSQLTLLDFIR